MEEYCNCGNKYEYNQLVWMGEAIEEWECTRCNKFVYKNCGDDFE